VALLDHAEEALEPRVEPTSELDVDEAGHEAVEALIAEILAPRAIEVEILTPRPKVRGLGKQPQAKQLSIICYLAYHRDVSTIRLRETFWPSTAARSTADNAISQVRTLLGASGTGGPRLTSACGEGTHQLSDEVGCDWTRFERLTAIAQQRPSDALLLLAAAVNLIQGQPGADAGSRQFHWLTDVVDLYAALYARLVETANRLGDLALAADLPDIADRAADKGLLITPGHEALYRIKMRAAAARRDPEAVEQHYGNLCAHVVADDPWADVDHDTAELYAELRNGPPMAEVPGHQLLAALTTPTRSSPQVRSDKEGPAGGGALLVG
jgi:hypothetical protein